VLLFCKMVTTLQFATATCTYARPFTLSARSFTVHLFSTPQSTHTFIYKSQRATLQQNLRSLLKYPTQPPFLQHLDGAPTLRLFLSPLPTSVWIQPRLLRHPLLVMCLPGSLASFAPPATPFSGPSSAAQATLPTLSGLGAPSPTGKPSWHGAPPPRESLWHSAPPRVEVLRPDLDWQWALLM